jgi:hypothetical protein
MRGAGHVEEKPIAAPADPIARLAPWLPTKCPAVARQNSDLLLNHDDEPSIQCGLSPCTTSRMLCLVKLLLVPVIMFFRSRRDLLMENLALRQQLAVFETKAFSSSACCSRQTFLGDIAAVLVPVAGDIDSRSAGDRCAMAPGRFQVYWTWLSRHPIRAGRKCVSVELRELIFGMVADNRAP